MKGGVYRMLTIQDLFFYCSGLSFRQPTFFLLGFIPHLSSEPFFGFNKVRIVSNTTSFAH